MTSLLYRPQLLLSKTRQGAIPETGTLPARSMKLMKQIVLKSPSLYGMLLNKMIRFGAWPDSL